MFYRYVFQYTEAFYLVLVFMNNAVADISWDFYLDKDGSQHSSYIRVGDCQNEALLTACYGKCGPNHACIENQCYCTDKSTPARKFQKLVIEKTSYEDTASESMSDDDSDEDEELGSETESSSPEETSEESESSEGNIGILRDQDITSMWDLETFLSRDQKIKPALRHHIAHFCPNLNVARVCIRKCMKVGKPAFCSKDHHCYCGHRYEYPAEDPQFSSRELQNQFSDLYEKYFGPKFPKSNDE